MILCSVDKSGRVFTISYHGNVDLPDVRQSLATISSLGDQLKPGFFLLTDLTDLKSMHESCAPIIGAVMDLFRAKGIAKVVRVIPDPSKDIGFNLMGHFHLHPGVAIQTHPTLADAVRSFLCEERILVEDGEITSDNADFRTIEDDLAESHFTTERRKEAEVNEGGVVASTL